VRQLKRQKTAKKWKLTIKERINQIIRKIVQLGFQPHTLTRGRKALQANFKNELMELRSEMERVHAKDILLRRTDRLR
jgi:hypothetical protein